MFGQLVGQRVERIGENLHGVHRVELLADGIKLLVDLGDRLHVDVELNAHLLTENPDQFDGRSRRTAREIPYIRIDDIGSCLDSGHDGSQAVARRAVGMEVDRNRQVLLEQLDQTRHALGRNQPAHVFDRDHVGAEGGHLLGLAQEILVGEYGLGQPFALEHGFEALHTAEMRIDRIADGAVGDAAVLLDVFDRRFDVVHVVQRVEDAHDAEPRLDRIAAESLDDLVGIGSVAEQVAASRKGRQLRHVAHHGVNLLEAVPRIFVQVAHHRVGYGAAPHFHCVEIGVLIERQYTVDLLLFHPRGERRLLSVAERQVSYQKFLCHS